MKTDTKELDLNELEQVNGGITPPTPTESEIEVIKTVIDWITSWFD